MEHTSAVIDLVSVVTTLLLIAAAVLALSKRLKLPFTVMLVVVGIALSELAKAAPALLPPLVDFHISPDVILFVFLPTLIFESSLHLDARELRRNLLPVLTARENVELPLRLDGRSRPVRRAIAVELLTRRQQRTLILVENEEAEAGWIQQLRHSLGLEDEAGAVEAAIAGVIADGGRTKDIAKRGEPSLTTAEMTAAILGKLD